MQAFSYERPKTLATAIEMMAGETARALAGGTDLIPQLREGRRSAGLVVDLKHVPAFVDIERLRPGGWRIGAAASIRRLGAEADLKREHPGLIEAGVEARVILATPTTLIALLRAVAYGWTQQALTENAERISALGRELYERIATLGDHWASVGKNLNDAIAAYNKSVGTLETRVLVTARKFQALQVASADKLIRDLNPVDTLPRALQSPELLTGDATPAADTADNA